MQTETLHPVGDYMQELFNFVVKKEGFKNGVPYFDTAKNPPRATIGYGFNIEAETDNLLLVLEQLGIINDTMTDAEITNIRNEFQTAINNTPNGDDDALIANLNQVASQYGVSSFQLNFDVTQGYSPQGYTIFREIIEGTNVGTIPIPGKQERLDALLNNSLVHNSKEYVAVMSLFYNAESLVNSKKKLLVNAIINDNRAEVWYEIRYNSNRDGQHASRRYKEADLFGLDNAGVQTEQESIKHAKDVYRMIFIHLGDIRNYEAKPTSSPTRSGVLSAFQQPEFLNSANLLYQKFGMEQTLQNVLVAPKVGGDPIQGTDKNELLLGDSGHDILIGGKGDDVMRGGAGKDLYVYNSGDGQDIIVDNPADGALDGGDGKGAIVYDGHLAGGGIKKAGESNYKSLDNTLTYQWSGNNGDDLTIIGSGGTLTVKGFSNGDLGITLKDAPNIVTNYGATTRTEFLRIDHYEQVGVERRTA